MDGDGKVLDRFYSLICPKEPSFDPFCTAVHHLEPADILSAPTIAEIADDIKAFIGSTPLVAHNAQFDIKVMNASLASWGIESVRNPYFCTLSLARKVMRGEPSYRLTALAAHFGWEYEAHNALADSEICGRLFKELCGDVLLDDEADRLVRGVHQSPALSTMRERFAALGIKYLEVGTSAEARGEAQTSVSAKQEASAVAMSELLSPCTEDSALTLVEYHCAPEESQVFTAAIKDLCARVRDYVAHDQQQ